MLLAAGAYETFDLRHMANLSSFLPFVAVGFVVAGVVGWFSIKWLLAYLNRNSLYAFAIYCAVVGLLCLGLQYFAG